MDDKQLNDLISRYLDGRCTPAELDIFLDFIEDKENELRVRRLLEMYSDTAEPTITEDKLERAYRRTDQSLKEILQQPSRTHSPNYLIKRLSLTAASIVAIISTAIWLWVVNSEDTTPPVTASYIATQSSTLTLPDGSSIVLEENLNAPTLIYDGRNVNIQQVDSQELVIHGTHESYETLEWLELKTAKGKKMKVTLEDGTLVWVNANSQFRFPVQFSNKERIVDLAGEAYFEVHHSKQRPFFVRGEEQLIQVYGTRFNVRNYSAEYKSSVTLFEGKLSVRKKQADGFTKEKMLVPGEHIDIHKSSELVEVTKLGAEEQDVTWLSDRKYYDDASLMDIFMDLSHQYELVINWEQIPQLRFHGYLPQGNSLDETLAIISTTAGIRITREDNIINF